jgi:hypothetical protein
LELLGRRLAGFERHFLVLGNNLGNNYCYSCEANRLTVLGFLAAEILAICAVTLASYFLIVYVGADMFPLRMRLIYRATRQRLARAGWGESTKAKRDNGESGEAYDAQYPNRRERS